MSSDANDRPDVTENQPEAPQTQAEPQTPDASTDAAEQEQERARRRILVGSQRDPAAYRPKPKQRDWIPSSEWEKDKDRGQKPAPESQPGKPAPADPTASAATASAPPAMPATAIAPPSPVAETPVSAVPAVEQLVVPAQPAPPVTAALPVSVAPPVPPTAAAAPIAAAPQPAVPAPAAPAGPREPQAEEPRGEEDRGRRGRRGRFRGDDADKKKHAQMAELAELMAPRRLPRPSVREQLSPEQEAELQEAMGGTSMEEMFSGTTGATQGDALEPESRHKGRVVAVQREDVFLELGGREQGILPVNSFEEPPEVGAEIEVIILRYKADEGLYELMLPGTAASVADWSQLSEGMLVEARVTGHNTGGLECEVNHIRGFIPISQISLYRVENLEEFLNQGMLCLVTEANPYRKNLVLSRRAVLEREKEEAKQKLLESLAPGQVHEGVVRKIMDFGAFVELGNGVDGLLHVSQLGWGRVKHPTDVVAEGQHIRVRIDKVDHETGRISLAYRDLMDNPWDSVDSKYLPNTPVHGKVVKLMEFGAFVELEPGVEGLVHISELAHKRVLRVSDVLKEGDEVDVMVLSVDRESRRISLSRKNVLPPPEPEVRPEAAAQPGAKPQEPVVEPPKPKKPAGPLKGGLGRSPGADRFGLKW